MAMSVIVLIEQWIYTLMGGYGFSADVAVYSHQTAHPSQPFHMTHPIYRSGDQVNPDSKIHSTIPHLCFSHELPHLV